MGIARAVVAVLWIAWTNIANLWLVRAPPAARARRQSAPRWVRGRHGLPCIVPPNSRSYP
jgi:hypothetical protein